MFKGINEWFNETFGNYANSVKFAVTAALILGTIVMTVDTEGISVVGGVLIFVGTVVVSLYASGVNIFTKIKSWF